MDVLHSDGGASNHGVALIVFVDGRSRRGEGREGGVCVGVVQSRLAQVYRESLSSREGAVGASNAFNGCSSGSSSAMMTAAVVTSDGGGALDSTFEETAGNGWLDVCV